MAKSKGEVGRAALPPEAEKVIILGQKAWEEIKAAHRKSWDQWLAIARALKAGHDLVEAQTGSPPGSSTHKRAYAQWRRKNGFGDLDKSDVSKLLKILGDLDRIERFRASLDDDKRAKLNSPSALWKVLIAWECPDRGGVWRDKNEGGGAEGEPSTSAPPEPGADDADKGAKHFIRSALLVADKAIGLALHVPKFRYGAIDTLTAHEVRAGAKALTKIADIFETKVSQGFHGEVEQPPAGEPLLLEAAE